MVHTKFAKRKYELTPAMLAQAITLSKSIDADNKIDADLEPEQFSAKYHVILNKNDELIPFNYNDIQRRALAETTGFDLYLKPRQVGISTWILSRIHHEALRTTTRALITMDIDSNTATSRDIFKRYHDELPALGGIPSRSAESATRTKFSNGSTVVLATARRETVGRGGTYAIMFYDECAHYKDLAKMMRGAMQAGSPRWVALASTANGAQGEFYELVMKALRYPHKSKFKLHFFEWWLERGYALPLEPDESLDYADDEIGLMKRHGLTPEQIKWRRDKINEIGGIDSFLQEYPEDVATCFQQSGNAFFMFPVGAFGVDDVAFNPHHQYFAGIDWGINRDFTVLSIVDATDGKLVALYRNNRTDYELIRADMINLMKQYNVSVCVPEINSEEENIQALVKESRNAGLKTRFAPFRTSGTNKMPMLNNLARAIRDGDLQLMDLPVLQAEFRSVQKRQNENNAWIAVDERGHTPDTVMSIGLALYGIANVPSWRTRTA